MNKYKFSHKISVAPMMGYTDRHARYLYRLISPSILLFTEMVTTKAILHGDERHILRYNQSEHPLVLQLGGSESDEFKEVSIIAAHHGFDEININVGCPSERVQSGAFGACLMKEPATVASCVSAVLETVDMPVSVKMRTGVDDFDSYSFLVAFINEVSNAGCNTFIVHARKAWLKGLSPKQNREIPPLHYDRVYKLKEDFPELNIIINGGVRSYEDVEIQLNHVDGVMLGREIVRNPWLLVKLEQILSGDYRDSSRSKIVHKYCDYIESQMRLDQPLHLLLRPLFGLSLGLPGARRWRQLLSGIAQCKDERKFSCNDLTDYFKIK